MAGRKMSRLLERRFITKETLTIRHIEFDSVDDHRSDSTSGVFDHPLEIAKQLGIRIALLIFSVEVEDVDRSVLIRIVEHRPSRTWKLDAGFLHRCLSELFDPQSAVESLCLLLRAHIDVFALDKAVHSGAVEECSVTGVMESSPPVVAIDFPLTPARPRLEDRTMADLDVVSVSGTLRSTKCITGLKHDLLNCGLHSDLPSNEKILSHLVGNVNCRLEAPRWSLLVQTSAPRDGRLFLDGAFGHPDWRTPLSRWGRSGVGSSLRLL